MLSSLVATDLNLFTKLGFRNTLWKHVPVGAFLLKQSYPEPQLGLQSSPRDSGVLPLPILNQWYLLLKTFTKKREDDSCLVSAQCNDGNN